MSRGQQVRVVTIFAQTGGITVNGKPVNEGGDAVFERLSKQGFRHQSTQCFAVDAPAFGGASKASQPTAVITMIRDEPETP